MSDGPTKVEAAREKLERAALSYTRAGRRRVSPENREKLARACERLERAAREYGYEVGRQSRPSHDL